MSAYSYPNSKIIDEVIYRTTERGIARAYLHAHADIRPETLRKITDTFQARGWDCIPYSLDGRPVLEVRGFRNKDRLAAVLAKNEWIDISGIKQTQKDERIGFTEKLKKRSLQGAGALYAWGDFSFIKYGIKGKSPLDVAAGIFYGLPTPVLLWYGRNDQSDLQIKDAARQLADYLKKDGDKLPENCTLEAFAADKKKGLIHTTNDVFRRYPSEFMNLCYAVAGACIFTAGVKHLKLNSAPAHAVDEWFAHMQKTNPAATRGMAAVAALKSLRTENWFNVGVGSFTTAAGLLGAGIKEKAPDPDQPPKKGMDGVWEWVRERPLAITGVGFMVSTLLHAVSTAVAMKGHDSEHKKSVVWRMSFVVASILAEILVAISSKGHGEGVVSDNSVDTSVIAIAADLIAKQPAHRQDQLIDYISKFLGRPDVLAIKDTDAAQQLRAQIESMRKNPWSYAELQGRSAASPPVWQTKVAASAEAAQLQ